VKQSSQPLKGKLAFIAGAGRGIGRAAALALAERGARIHAVARTESDLASLLEELPGSGHSILTADLSTEAGCETLLDSMRQHRFADIVVANLNVRSQYRRITDEQFSFRGEALADGVAYLTKIAPETLAHQKQSRFGRWIGIGSIVASMGGPGQGLYSAQKKVLESFLITLAVEHGRDGITANLIEPGFIDTHGTRSRYPKERFDKLGSMNLLGRPGKAEEVAHLIASLADPLAGYITGCVIPVCGGTNLSWPLVTVQKQEKPDA